MKKTRRIVQFGFLALTVVGVYFLEGNAERWCPFGGVEAAYLYITQGNMLCSLGISNFYILGAVLLMTVLLRRAFCGYMCPIGAISEWLGAGATRCGVKPAQVTGRADAVLRSLKYGVLAAILVFTWKLGELVFRGYDPCYALISRHGEDITEWAYVVAGSVVVLSLLVTMPFCRWLCPLGAVFNPFSRFGFTRIKRNESTCTGCKKCTRSCPMAIPVSEVMQVDHARCMSCMNCVDVCPELDAGALSWGPPRKIGGNWSQRVLLAILGVCVTGAVAAAYFVPMPSFVRERGEKPAQIAIAHLKVEQLTCRGKGTLFASFVEREDDLAIPGYVRIEAWPGPGAVDAKIHYDPAQTNEQAIKRAITEPLYQAETREWKPSPFVIEGYDPLAVEESEPASQPAE